MAVGHAHGAHPTYTTATWKRSQFGRSAVRPFQGRNGMWLPVRGRRCALPPATLCDPFRVDQTDGRRPLPVCRLAISVGSIGFCPSGRRSEWTSPSDRIGEESFEGRRIALDGRWPFMDRSGPQTRREGRMSKHTCRVCGPDLQSAQEQWHTRVPQVSRAHSSPGPVRDSRHTTVLTGNR